MINLSVNLGFCSFWSCSVTDGVCVLCVFCTTTAEEKSGCCLYAYYAQVTSIHQPAKIAMCQSSSQPCLSQKTYSNKESSQILSHVLHLSLEYCEYCQNVSKGLDTVYSISCIYSMSHASQRSIS